MYVLEKPVDAHFMQRFELVKGDENHEAVAGAIFLEIMTHIVLACQSEHGPTMKAEASRGTGILPERRRMLELLRGLHARSLLMERRGRRMKP